MLTLIIFLIILAVLVLVHEFGHFVVAKAFGIRVDEFGLGFPPRIFGWRPKRKLRKPDGTIEIVPSETIYTLNWIPFGGFVKIFGEDGDGTTESKAELGSRSGSRNFADKSKWVQVAVLVAGVSFNVIFAWLLISGGYLAGLPSSVSDDLSLRYPQNLTDVHLTVTSVLAGSPAEQAGLKVGDAVVSLSAPSTPTTPATSSVTPGNSNSANNSNDQTNPAVNNLQTAQLNPDTMAAFTAGHGGVPIIIGILRGKTSLTLTVTPKQGIAGVVGGKAAIGISMDMIGRLHLSFLQSFYEGARLTWYLIEATVIGFWQFISQIFAGHADFSQVSGPVGIEGLVGDAQQLGFIYLLSFTALISINLAIVNLLPFPALDGGRVLFVAIEAVRRKRINPKIVNAINNTGFALLILLLVAVTYKDIVTRFF